MIEIITRDNASFFKDALNDMFHMRYRVAVEQWAWDIPIQRPYEDRDEFDHAKTIYFIKRNDSGAVIGCARLNPTVLPHMFTEIFSDFCDFQEPPRDATTYELSRFFVDKTLISRSELYIAIWEILAAVSEFCVDVGIKNLSWFAYQLTYNTSLEVWNTRPLGRPSKHPNDVAVYVPAVSAIDELSVEKTKLKARLAGQSWNFAMPGRDATVSAQVLKGSVPYHAN